MPIESFEGGGDSARHKLNELVRAANAVRKVQGDGRFINTLLNDSGLSVALRKEGIMELLAKFRVSPWGIAQLQTREAGGGKYGAKLSLGDIRVDVSPTSNLTGTDFGTLADDVNALVYNPAEMNGNYHALPVGGQSPFVPVIVTSGATSEADPRVVCILMNQGLVSCMAKVTGVAGGMGKYYGTILTTPVPDIDPNADLADDDMGVTPGTNCYILNAMERGRATGTHILSSGKISHGRIIKFNTDNTPIVVFDTFEIYNCT